MGQNPAYTKWHGTPSSYISRKRSYGIILRNTISNEYSEEKNKANKSLISLSSLANELCLSDLKHSLNYKILECYKIWTLTQCKKEQKPKNKGNKDRATKKRTQNVGTIVHFKKRYLNWHAMLFLESTLWIFFIAGLKILSCETPMLVARCESPLQCLVPEGRWLRCDGC